MQKEVENWMCRTVKRLKMTLRYNDERSVDAIGFVYTLKKIKVYYFATYNKPFFPFLNGVINGKKGI